jgi:hypothetical protein
MAEIFKLTIRDLGSGNYSVFRNEMEQEAVFIQFSFPEHLTLAVHKLHERGGLGFIDYLTHENACSQIGESLFTSFITGINLEKLRQHSKQYEEPRLALCVPRALYWLPWELLRDPTALKGQFFSRIGSIIRYETDLPIENSLVNGQHSRSTYMFLFSNPEDRPLGGTFVPVSTDPIVFAQIKPASYTAFGEESKMDRSQGLVFFGHGERNGKYGRLVFETAYKRTMFSERTRQDPKLSYSIGDVVAKSERLRLAFILACESAWIDQNVAFEYSVTGAMLVRTHIAFVVAMQAPITFVAAREFLETTVEALAKGNPLDLAVSQGRCAIRDFGSSLGEMDWWIPVIYSRTANFDIFPRLPPVAVPELRGEKEVLVHPIPRKATDAKSVVNLLGTMVRELFTSTANESVFEQSPQGEHK